MKLIAKYVVLAGLLGSVGCTGIEKAPESPQVKSTKSAKPIEEENVPEAVSKLLPPEQIDERNANAQARAMFDQLQREKGQLERTESAKRE